MSSLGIETICNILLCIDNAYPMYVCSQEYMECIMLHMLQYHVTNMLRRSTEYMATALTMPSHWLARQSIYFHCHGHLQTGGLKTLKSKPLVLYGSLWISMDFYGSLWISMVYTSRVCCFWDIAVLTCFHYFIGPL